MKACLIFILVLILACQAGSQSNSPGSLIRDLSGLVVDPTGALVTGAQVTLIGPNGTVLGRATTDNAGIFVFRAQQLGKYQLRIVVQGFEDSKSTVTLDRRGTPNLKIVLHLASLSQTVSVDSGQQPQVSSEAAENQSVNSVDRADLEHLPVFDMDYVTTLSRFLSDDAVGTNGVSLVVNGMEANGPGVPPSAIKNVKINQNPYSALFSRPGRARIEITTDEGTKDFHGSASFLFRDSVFDASNFFASVKPPERRTFFDGTLTGPLGHSKSNTFLLSGENDNDDQQATVDAIDASGPVHQTVATPLHHLFVAARAFHDYPQGDQLWVSYSYEYETQKNQGVGGTVLPEAGANYSSFEHEVNVSHRRVISPRIVNQLHFLVGYNDEPTRSISSAPSIVVQGAFTGGGAQADYRRTEGHFDGTDLVTWSTSKHDLKFGIDVPDISRRGFDDYRFLGGAYSFATLADYVNSNPYSYTVQQGQGHVTFLEKTVAGFFEDTIRLRANLSLAAGVRYYWQNYFHDIATNFAPRLSLAYAPGKSSGTVFRTGAGIFYDRSGPRPISDLIHFDGQHLVKFIDPQPTYPESAARLALLPPGFTRLDPQARIPYLVQYSAGVERQVTARSTFAANYIGTRGIDQFRSVDANAPIAPNFNVRPDPRYGQMRQIQSTGYLKGNALELVFRGKPVTFFSGQAQYTLGKTYNNTSGILSFPAYSYDPQADWSRSDNDRRHKFDMLGTFKARNWFDFGTALSLYSGKPVDVTTGNDENGDGLALDRPAGTPRNSLHGPGTTELDLNLTREFPFHKGREEGRTLSVSVSAFNVFNHPNDVTYVGVITSPFFDKAVQAQPGRRMQLNLEWKF